PPCRTGRSGTGGARRAARTRTRSPRSGRRAPRAAPVTPERLGAAWALGAARTLGAPVTLGTPGAAVDRSTEETHDDSGTRRDPHPAADRAGPRGRHDDPSRSRPVDGQARR